MNGKPHYAADLTPKQLQGQLQKAVFVGVFGANFVFGAAVLILSLLLR